jgi:phospholipase C
VSRRRFLGGAGAVAGGALVAGQMRVPAGAAALVQSTEQIDEALGVLGKERLRQPGSLPFPDLAAGTDTLPEIQHIVLLMMENHSYDNLLGTLEPRRSNGTADGFTVDRRLATPGDAWDPKGGWSPDGVVASNPNGAGKFQWAYHMATTCQHSGSPTQEWSASHEQLAGGKLDGFVTCVSYGMPKPAGPVGMAYWNGGDIPVLHGLATAFPIADRWFQSLLGQTDPNRRFLIAGTSAGMTDDIALSTSPTMRDIVQDTTLPIGGATIFDTLTTFGITWINYSNNGVTGETPNLFPEQDGPLDYLRTRPLDAGGVGDFFADCKAGTLPAFSFLDENYSTQSQENPQDIVVGERLIHDVVTALAASPLWSRTLLLLTYDEHGGYYDHVVPPVALVPDSIGPVVQPGQDTYDGFARYGFRVPTLVVSPYAIPNGVTHSVYDHTSLLAMIERKWNLPALTIRDANANDLMGFLDHEALEAGKAKPFEDLCPSLPKAAPSHCPAKAPPLPPPGSVRDRPA